MKDKYAELDQEVKDWIHNNEQKLGEDYHEYIENMRDSIGHKTYMLNNENCFWEWCEEQFDNISLGD